MKPLPGVHYTPRRGIGADEEDGAKVPLWAAMVALIGTAFLFGRKQR
jgi:hypothetical protein